jgi:hypothetical protein
MLCLFFLIFFVSARLHVLCLTDMPATSVSPLRGCMSLSLPPRIVAPPFPSSPAWPRQGDGSHRSQGAIARSNE